jgi:hypothetical protein
MLGLALQDIVKDNGHPYFMSVLQTPLDDSESNSDPVTLRTHAECVFILTMLCDGFSQGQQRCFDVGFMDIIFKIIDTQHKLVVQQQMLQEERRVQQAPPGLRSSDWKDGLYDNLLLLAWSLLALGKLCDGQPLYIHTAMQRYDAVRLFRVRP